MNNEIVLMERTAAVLNLIIDILDAVDMKEILTFSIQQRMICVFLRFFF